MSECAEAWKFTVFAQSICFKFQLLVSICFMILDIPFLFLGITSRVAHVHCRGREREAEIKTENPRTEQFLVDFSNYSATILLRLKKKKCLWKGNPEPKFPSN